MADKSRTDRLRRLVSKMPREDGLALACTFDRCWFDWSMIGETATALEAMAEYAPTAEIVARVLRDIRGYGGDLGIAFAPSISNAWHCKAAATPADITHVVGGGNGRSCARMECSKELLRALELVSPAGSIPKVIAS
jgi:hypothetical protein